MCRSCKRIAATRYNHSAKARASRAKYEQTDAGQAARKKARRAYRHSAKGKAARKVEATRRRTRLATAQELGEYYRDFEHSRQLRSLCSQIVKIIFPESLT